MHQMKGHTRKSEIDKITFSKRSPEQHMTLTKISFQYILKDFFSKSDQTAVSCGFTEEILNAKLHFLCSDHFSKSYQDFNKLIAQCIKTSTLRPPTAANGQSILFSELILKPQRFLSTKNYYTCIRYCGLSITHFALLLISIRFILGINVSKTQSVFHNKVYNLVQRTTKHFPRASYHKCNPHL